jgi:predicted nucleotide-binding protein
MELVNVIGLLKKKLEDLRKDASIRDFDGGGFRAWAQGVEAILIRGIGGPGTRLLAQFRKATWGLPMPDSIIDPGYQEGMYKRRFESKLLEVEAVLETIVWELEAFGLPDTHVEAGIRQERPKVFIGHGGESVALDKLCRFLKALEVEALVVEEQPSKAKALDDKVEHYMAEADCAIILATGDDEIEGKLHPRQNVIHEIGLAQKTFPDKIIYLLEEGTEFPSNIKPKVWESFTQESMDEAFIAVARELRAFGLIRAAKECK